MHVYVISVLRASFLSSFRRTKRNPDVARGKPYYLLDPLLTIISFFFLFFIYVLLKWTTHLDVRTVSNLLQSLTTSFPLRLFSLRFSTVFLVTGPALNLRTSPHNFMFADHQNALISIFLFRMDIYRLNVLDCQQPSCKYLILIEIAARALP